MTNQEAFDKVWKWFIVDRNPRAVNGNICRYRTAGEIPAKCAVGCLIPDELYRPRMECRSVQRIISEYVELANFFNGVSQDMLSQLQRGHDDAGNEIPYENMEHSFRYVAKCFNLTIPASASSSVISNSTGDSST